LGSRGEECGWVGGDDGLGKRERAREERRGECLFALCEEL